MASEPTRSGRRPLTRAEERAQRTSDRIERERKRGSDRDVFGELEFAKVAVETADAMQPDKKSKKPLKPYRSQAERTRVRQGYCLIVLAFTNICITTLIALHSFGIIA